MIRVGTRRDPEFERCSHTGRDDMLVQLSSLRSSHRRHPSPGEIFPKLPL